MNLYQIDQKLVELVENANSETGEINIEAFEALELEKKTKQTNIVKYIRHLELDEDAVAEEIKRLSAIKTQITKRSESLKKYLKSSMELDNVDQLDLGLFKASIVKNPPSVVIEDEAKLDAFKKEKVTITLDKTAIKEALKNGKVDGAKLIQSTRLKLS